MPAKGRTRRTAGGSVWEEDPGTTDLEIEEEGQPPGEPVKEQGNEETRGSASEALGRLRRKIEEKKHQEERRNVSLWKKIQDSERSFSEGAGELDRQTYAELLEREGVMLGLEAALGLVDQARAEQDTQQQTKATTAGSEGTNLCVLQDQQAVPSRPRPHTGQPASGRTPENQEPGRPPYNRQGTTDSEGLLAGREKGDLNRNKVLQEEPGTLDTSGPTDPMTPEDLQAPEDPQAPGQPPTKEL